MRCATRVVFLILVSLSSAACCKSEQEALRQTTLIPANWEVVEDVELVSNLDAAKLRFKPLLKDGESWISGKEMRERAVMLRCNLGLRDAKRLLADQDKIPADLRVNYIVLPGTVLRNPGGDLHVAYLFWNGDRWALNFRWLDLRFRARDLVPCSE